MPGFHLHSHEEPVDAITPADAGQDWAAFAARYRACAIYLQPARTRQDIITSCREHLAHFKAPSTVVFDEWPKTLAGKAQNFKLHDRATALEG